MISFEVENVTCGGCVAKIEKELSALPEVTNVSVNLESKVVTLETTDDNLAAVESKLKEIGYPKKASNDLLQKAKNYLKNNQQ